MLLAGMSASGSIRFCYSSQSPFVLLASAAFFFILVVGGFWVLLAKHADPVAEMILSGIMIPVAGLCWVMLRGGMDRRGFILVETAGIIFGREGRKEQRLTWEEIREIRHVWLSPDPHLALVGVSDHIRRIYYSLERVDELVEMVAQRAERITNGYALPLNLNRPGLLRALALPVACAAPAFALAAFPLLKGVWTPALLLGGFGGFIVVVSLWLHRRQPLAISVSEATGIVWRKADETRSIDWGRLTAFGLELADRGVRRPVLVIQIAQACRLVIDLGWVDPVRFYALIFAHHSACRTESAGLSTPRPSGDSGTRGG